MKLIRKRREQAALLFMIALVASIFLNRSAFADPLIYSGNQRSDLLNNTQVQQAQGNVVPVPYSTSYDTQFAQFSSFMQAPSNNGPFNQYGQPSAPMMNPATANMQDPYRASEVSPYTRYSPYLEVVGEGSKYTLGIDDIVTIIVRDQPDFSGRFVVDPEGNIQYNFVGDIPAVGKTKGELRAEILNRLQKFVRYPEAAVMISEYRSKAVYVLGFVNHPGKFAMKGDQITVMEAVVAAGLPRTDGSLSRVYVVRPSKYNKDNKPTSKKIDLKKLLEKGISAEDFVLEPGDMIVVNQRYFDRFVNAYSRIVGPILQTAAVYDLGFGRPQGGFLGGKRSTTTTSTR